VGDFNGDGIADLALSAGGPSQPLVIFLGSANGTFTVAPTLTLPYSAYDFHPIAVADFNGDGVQDIAALDGDSNTVTILLGNGDGTFTPTATSPTVGSNPNQLAVGDFNGDGIPDLAVTTSSSSSLNILLGNGDGTFAATSNSPVVGGSPYSIVAGDFNGDGELDLAVTDTYDDTVSVLLGNGDGTFASATTFACGINNSPLAVADFNNDGKLDLAVGISGNSGTGDSVAIFVGNGDGTFTSPTPLPAATSNSISSIHVGDFNADGIPDVAATDSRGRFTVFVGSASGSFTATTQVLGSDATFGLSSAVGDLNGDGRTDLVLGEFGYSVLVYVTEPTETATASANVTLAGVGQHQVDASYAGDSNYNSSASGTLPLWGVPPATTTSLTLTSSGAQVTSIAPGSGVTLTATVKAGASPVTTGQVNFCDASAASCTDIHLLGRTALTSSGTAAFKYVPGPGAYSYKAEFVQDGYGLGSASSALPLTVGPAPATVYSNTTAIANSGFPGDYSLTATVTGVGGSASPTGTISFLDTSFGNTSLATARLGTSAPGIGWLISQTAAAGGNLTFEVTGDFNGDGIPDLAVLWPNANNSSAEFTIFFGKGDGTFTAGPTTQTQIPTETFAAYMIAGDFNGDGKTDLAVLSYSFFSFPFESSVTALLGNGDGTFTVSASSVVFNQGPVGGDGVPGAMTAADFNGDGKMDLAVVGDYISSGGVSILLGNGDGTFTAMAPNLDTSADFGQIATGDFNGDGIPDLVATNYFEDGSAPTIFLGKGDGTFTSAAASFPLDYFPTSIAVGDFNGDGVLDLAFSDLNGVEIALGVGDGTFKETSASPILVPSELYSLVVGDFNHDGKLDIAGVDSYDDAIDVLIGAGDGTFTVVPATPPVSQSFLGPFAIVAADFNQDGTPDLALLTKNLATASILLTEPTQTSSATVNNIAPVGAGTHNVEADYAGDANYSATVSGTVALTAGMAPLAVSPASGTFTSAQTVTISESVPGATIYYQASGIVHTNGFVVYTGPIQLNEGGSETIQAYAAETGYQQSNYTTAAYTVNLPAAAAPVFSVAAGRYPGVQSVTITDSAPGAMIYYTANGAPPSVHSTQYTGPIAVTTSETLAAVAIAPGYSVSAPVSAQYLIGSSPASLIYSVAGNGSAGYSGDGGPALLGGLNNPGASVLDSAGNLYIVDSGNNVVRKVSASTGVITTIAGNGTGGYSGDKGPATSAQLNYPEGLALDGQGNLYIADSGNNVVRELTAATGVITTVAGNGIAGYSGDNGAATAAQLNYPETVADDSAGNLYIADTYNNVIRKVTLSSGTITTVAGNSQRGYSGDGGAATAATLQNPFGVALDSAGNMYISDTGNQVIREVHAATGVMSTVAGNGYGAGGYDGGYSGDGGPATSAELNSPEGLAFDSAGDLYIADNSNQVIREVAAATGVISTVAGGAAACDSLSGDGGPVGSAALCYPQNVFVGSTGNLYITSPYLERIRVATASGSVPTNAAATPTFSVAAGTYAAPQTVTITDSTPGAAIYVSLDGSTPTTVGQGYKGPINVSGNVTIQAVAVGPGYLASTPASAAYTIAAAPAHIIKTLAGSGVSGFSAIGGAAASVQIGSLTGLTLDSAGDLYFADTTNNVVWEVAANTGVASVVAGTGTPGYTGDGGAATSATLNSPNSVAVDAAGNLYIADTDNNVIREVMASTGWIATIAGSSQAGSLGDGGPAIDAQLSSPNAVALDSTGNLYIADTYNARVRVVSASTGIITTVAGNGNSIFSGDGGPAISAGLSQPNALALDKAGNLYIASYYGGRIRKVVLSTGIISTVAGNGNYFGSSGDGGLATMAEISPQGLAVDSAGNLYISDWQSAVRVVSAKTEIITRLAGNGYYAYSGDGGSATIASLNLPAGIAFDASGNLYIADSGNYRVREVSPPSPAATPVISPASGPYMSAQNATITDNTAGAVIYYTTDGTTPTSASTVYGGPIVISTTTILKAIASAPGSAQSAVATATYTIPLGTAAATLTLTPSTPTITDLQTVSVAVAVAGADAAPIGNVTLASGSYSAQQPLASGAATFTIPAGALSAGANTLTASYSGDINYAAASGTTTVTVAAVVVTSPSPAAVSPGGSTTATATFSAGSTYSGTMNLTCALTASPTGAQSLPTCSLNPASITIASGGTASTVVKVNTTAASSGSALLSPGKQGWEALSGGGVMALALLFGMPSWRRRKALMIIALFATTAGGAVGCGGGGSSTTNPPPNTSATTAGSYTFSVVGTDSSNAKITVSTNITVVVQ
jgi:sugar lactone lactonase YvrE